MALTRKFLKGMGLTEEQIDTIIESHTEVVDGLKEEIKALKTDADALPGIKKQLEEAQSALDTEKKDSWKVKYDAIKEEYDNYKAEQTKKETHTQKEDAMRALLKEIGVSEKRIPAVLKVSDVDSLNFDSEGKIKDSGDLKKSLKEEWSDFIVTTTQQGTNPPNPPANTGGGKKTKEEIFKIKDPIERQNAIGENIELFTGKEN